MTRQWNWPTREQWAANRRTLCGDMGPNLGWQITDYADEAEILAAIAALETLWRDLGRQMKMASKEPRSNLRGDNEYDELRWRRQTVNRTLKDMREGKLPWESYIDETLKEMFAPFYVRQHKDYEERLDQKRREVEATPIHDEAWEKELQWRRKLEDDDAHPERFIHLV